MARVAASREQTVASDPAGSVWVTANAGSGKTHVLVNRLIRLLLEGTPPERILCLTYTRAAAAEMSTRLFNTLGAWLALDEDGLIEVIHEQIGKAQFSKAEHAHARRLFTRALETPGGLKVQTIHAFCERLLQRFPVEAGVVPGFEIISEELRRRELLNARAVVLGSVADDPSGALARDVETVSTLAAEVTFNELLGRIIARRDALDWLARSPELIEPALARALDIDPAGTAEDYADTYWRSLDTTGYEHAREVLGQRTTKTDQDQAGRVGQLLTANSAAAAVAALAALYRSGSGAARADSGVMTKKARADHPTVAAFLDAEAVRFDRFLDEHNRYQVQAASASLTRIGLAVVDAYEASKQRQGVYDYDDLVTRTRSLLYDRDAAQWVLYRLDGGLDHILIDEAQDTSPQQWEIVRMLAEEFFAGAGAREGVQRTLFAVGDRKQSIFSFQGADPTAFDAMQAHFAGLADQARLRFSEVPLDVSFRSTQQVLDAVDAVFRQGPASAGVIEPDHPVRHIAHRKGEAGMIEIWPVVKSAERPEQDPWAPPQPGQPVTYPHVTLARRIAETIRHWHETGETLKATGRKIRFGDILILVRRRQLIADALIRALKQRGIPVAGADRLVLTDHIAVQDLMSLGRFVLLPGDCLSLAEVLKSPLVARDDGKPIDDDDLFGIAHGRKHKTLWQSLGDAVGQGAPLSDARARLGAWRSLAGFVPPYEFYNHVLVRDGGRQRLLARLGSEAGDPLDAFLAEALQFERDHTPSLNGFLAHLENTDAQIKRDMEQGGDEVRIMTVHGAKGLEAGVVFLPDTCGRPDGGRHEPLAFAGGESFGRNLVPVWRPGAALANEVTDRLTGDRKRTAVLEHNRLLYVAMTRARDRLYVCGWSNSERIDDECWYGLVHGALADDGNAVRDANGEVACWRIEGTQEKPAEPAKPGGMATVALPVAPEPWALAPPDRQPVPQDWLSPSRFPAPDSDNTLARDHGPALSPLDGQPERRFARGLLIHKLLQVLPDAVPADRETAARRYLAEPGHGIEVDEQIAIAQEVLAITEATEHARLFGPGSRAEVPVVARITLPGGEEIAVNGLIDRLVVADDEILLVDFKTNRPPPHTADRASPLYIRQMAAYRAALAQIYPDHAIRAFLLWTAGPRIMEVPPMMMDRQLPLSKGSRITGT